MSEVEVATVFKGVVEELCEAKALHPSWPTDTIHQVAIIQEECGELMREALQLEYEPHKGSKQRLYNEAVQTAAMALRFLIEFEDTNDGT